MRHLHEEEPVVLFVNARSELPEPFRSETGSKSKTRSDDEVARSRRILTKIDKYLFLHHDEIERLARLWTRHRKPI
jgi:hypothetical protein